MPEPEPAQAVRLQEIASRGLDTLLQRMDDELMTMRDDWPDYVFAEDYCLPTLQSVLTYVREHGHLPGMVSAAQVEAGDFNAEREIGGVLRPWHVEHIFLWLNMEIVHRELSRQSIHARSEGSICDGLYWKPAKRN